ncbi:MAG: cob(I)yrinic acid a,c-diamide adenosyltransferase [Clostridia bacterium]|nr:cob(I)yrinic acid a,c-diamide adenosyltransferase [Clostridia bacterium]
MIHILYGNGRGKTSSAFGLALRMAGHGGRVLVVQFIKDGQSGEVRSVRHVPGIETLHPNPYLDPASNRAVWEQAAARAAAPDGLRLIVLDEVLDAMAGGALTLPELADSARACAASGVELVITGHDEPPREIAGLADYITRFESIRHPYDRGIPAREGVEY